MSYLRVLTVSAISLLFLTGADHRESPALAISHGVVLFDHIEVLSWSWGETNDSSARKTPGAKHSAEARLKRGQHSEHLQRWHKERTVIASMIFTGYDENRRMADYHLTNVRITSYSVSGSPSEAEEPPMETLALNFEEIKTTY